ncbi:MAG: carboxypeptidase regulatory-like domain-containing protein [Candidatus Zixiibacteriota bacterium]|nr:MAG: carboxypeptidase regulatory-like domain-containing protein [candidate division Zixibacteria bacterium]
METSSKVFVRSENAAVDASKLESEGFDVLRGRVREDGFEMIVSPAEYLLLVGRGYELEILDKGRPLREIQADRSLGLDLVPTGYPDYVTVVSQMTDFAAAYPSICRLYDLTDYYGLPATYEGNHIYALKISDNVGTDEDEPSFLMVSCHHAREIVTPVIALYSIEQLLTGYGSDPGITALVDNNEIWISCVWNPDGYEYVFEVDNWWRKNRQPYSLYYGVDLNRNYAFGWDSYCSGSSYPYSETYKGPSPASEVETRTMEVFHNDRNFAKMIDYHSYGRELLYEYCCHDHPFVSYLYSEAVLIATQAGYQGNVRTPSAEGENYEWQLATNGTYAFLMETHSEFQPPYELAQAEAANVWPSAVWMLEREIPISGHVTDYATGQPLAADINIVGVTFPNGEYFRSDETFGRYHLFVPAGTYDIEFSKTGYETQVHNVTVTSGNGEVLDVALLPPNEPPGAPLIVGPEEGLPEIEYTFTFESSDPDGDDVYYFVDWGDGDTADWVGPYTCGEPVALRHTWLTPGSRYIRAKARDTHYQESDFSEHRIRVPRKKRT